MRIVYICYVGWKVKGTAVKRQWTVKRKRQHKAVEGQGNGSEKAVDGQEETAVKRQWTVTERQHKAMLVPQCL